MRVGARLLLRARVWDHLGEEDAELLEGLQQTGVLDLLDDEDTLRRGVPGQSLAGRVLNVPGHTNTKGTLQEVFKRQPDTKECVRGRGEKKK